MSRCFLPPFLANLCSIHCFHFSSSTYYFEGDSFTLDTNWLKQFKEFVKFSYWWRIWLFGCNIRGTCIFKNRNFKVRQKYKWAHTFFVKLSGFNPHDTKSVQYLWLQKPRDSWTWYVLSIFITNVLVDPSKTVSSMVM